LVNGITYQFNVTATDAAGNVSAMTSNVAVTGDTTAPTINLNTVNDDVGTITGNLVSGARTDDTSLLLSGTTESGSTVKVYNGLVLLGNATVSGTSWTYSATVANGTTYQFNATATDVAGNVSAATSNFTVISDTASPAVTLATITDDIGTVVGNLVSGARTDDTSLLLSGTTESGSTVKVYNGIELLGTGTVVGTGWTYSATVINGTTYQFNTTATDTAGNTSAATSNFTVISDTAAPTSATSIVLTPVGGTLRSNTLNTTNTHLTATASIILGESTGGSAVLKVGGVAVATDSTILVGDTSVTFTTSDGTPINSELRTLISSGGLVTVELSDAAGNKSISSISNPTLLVDYASPTVTNNSGTYTNSTNTLIITGTNYNTLLEANESSASDIKARLNWSKLSWDINGDNATTADVSFLLNDIISANVTDSTHLSIVFTIAKGASLEATSNFGGGNDTLDITTGFAIDTAGNPATSDAISNAVLSTSVAGQSVIDLGAFGKLIAPIQADGGNWYYFWDRSGNGSSTNSGRLFLGNDFTTHNVLDSIFTEDINGVVNPAANAGTTDTYRYATINGVRLALPTVGGISPYQGTSINSSAVNSRYNDLLAIWDSKNGIDSSLKKDGMPIGWGEDEYVFWSATKTNKGHSTVALGELEDNISRVEDNFDIQFFNRYVALQVL
jgi:hypothetical protein